MKITKLINLFLSLILFITGLIYVPRIISSIWSEYLLVSDINQNVLSFLQKGDVISSINGDTVSNPDLVLVLFTQGKQYKYPISIIRNGEKINGEVVVSDHLVGEKPLHLELVKKLTFSFETALYFTLFFIYFIIAFYLTKHVVWANIGAFIILSFELFTYILANLTQQRLYFFNVVLILSILCVVSFIPLMRSLISYFNKLKK